MKRALVSFLVAGSLGALAAQAQPILYGIAGDKGSDVLYTIDPSSGAATEVGDIGFSRCSALEASDAGVLYAVCQDDSEEFVLVTIDRSTGAGTDVGPLNIDGVRAVTDIAFDAGGVLYAYVRRFDADDALYTIDLATGAATLVGANQLDQGGNGISFAGGVLYHVGDTSLSSLSTTDGAETELCPLGQPDPQETLRANALDTHPETGVLYASLLTGGEGAGDYFLGTVALCAPAEALTALGLKGAGPVGEAAITVIGDTVSLLDAIAFLVPPDLAITKTDAPDPVVAGSNLTYTITVENLGLAAATNVVVTDTLPAEVTLVSSDGCVEDPSGGDPTCTIASIPGEGSAVVTLVVNVSPLFSGTLINTATIAPSAANTIDSNDSATAETLVSAAPPSAIPTLSEWALGALVLLLTVTGVLFVRRV